jgi:hypothetical protein
MDMPVRVTLARGRWRRARRRAAEQGLTLSDYIAELVARDLEGWAPDGDVPLRVPVSDGGYPPDHAGIYIGEAVAARMSRRRPAEE